MGKASKESPPWPFTHRGTVYPWMCDHMGHMNVRWYVAKFDEASWQFFSLLGLTPSYFRDRHRGVAGLDQKISYKKELRPGDVVSVRSALLEMQDKTIRFVHEMTNDETGEVAASAVLTGAHFDTDKRKACRIPEEIRRKAAGLRVDYDPEE